MITTDNINKKAFAEAVLYYLNERESGNFSIKFIIITDFYQFFIFDAKDFEVFNQKNHPVKKCYNEWKNGQSLFKGTTGEFYQELQKIIFQPISLDFLKTSLLDTGKFNAGYFDIRGEKSQKDLFCLYKFFHSDFLLKRFNPNDANSLNQDFYNELLYILGFYEKKQGNKIVILPSLETQQGQGTLYFNILSNLDCDKAEINEISEPVLEILIIWLNRILFLKLLETSLVNYNKNDHSLKFLNKTKIQSFKALNNLFFDTLAQKPEDRKNFLKDIYYLPYLNSSLFTRNDKKELIEISSLDNMKLDYFKHTQIKDQAGIQKTGSVEWLDYLFEFLDAFDFGGEAKNEEFIFREQKILINSSVLGLVFEKLNGYKEGSFYTPNSITSYMCQISLEKIVLQKFIDFDDNFKDCKNLNELKNEIWTLRSVDKKILDKADQIILSIKICDPAVGSGHFLVSALNEMIYIKYKLGILGYSFRQSNIYKNFEISDLKIENDEIIAQDGNGEIFEYKKPSTLSDPNHLIQQMFFEEKKAIIENCLFGVDINPNSSEICRLRLWIELLKNTYYLDLDPQYQNLQTLPNIDINIKDGNSLIYRFDLKDSLKYFPNIDYAIKDYKKLVNDYKNSNGSSKQYKEEIARKIQDIKEKFQLTLKDEKTNKILSKEVKSHLQYYGDIGLDNDLLFSVKATGNLFQNQIKLNDIQKQKALESAERLLALKEKIDSKEKGESYKNAFEWRFEFPEVLDENGDFQGFDLVIGNPPYVVKKKSEYPDYQWNTDLYLVFLEMGIKITKSSYYLSYITPKFWMINANCKNFRQYILNNINLIRLSKTNPFKNAITENIIIFMQKTKNMNYYREFIEFYEERKNKFDFIKNIYKEDIKNEIIINIDNNIGIVLNKIRKNSIALGKIIKSKRGAEYGKNFIRQFKDGKKILLGYDVSRYAIKWEYTFVNENLDGIKRLMNFFESENLIYLRRVDKRLSASVSNEKFAFIKNIYGIKVIDSKYSYKFILALLNSKLLNFYYLKKFTTKKEEVFPEIQTYLYQQLPIIKITKQAQSLIHQVILLADQILQTREKDISANISELESKIDNLIYKLYNLTETEIGIIEKG